MKSKLLYDNLERTFALVFETGDRVIEGLEAFAVKANLWGAHFTGIGAFQQVTLGYFDWETKSYKKIPVDRQVEVLTLAGDVALWEGRPKVHAHVVIGSSDGTAQGGHLLEAQVRPTLELIITETPVHLRREMDKETGLPLIRL
jgi:hypothetical protein